MKWLFLFCLPLASVASAQSDDWPHKKSWQIDCKSIGSRSISQFEADGAALWIPLRFNITNSEKRLKFYEAEIQFTGSSKVLPVQRATFYECDLIAERTRFPDLQKRAADDDTPTTFFLGGQEFEISSRSPIPRRMTDANSFSLDFEGLFEVAIETVPSSGGLGDLVWVAKCKFVGPESKS